MSDENHVPATLETIAEKVTALSASIDARFTDLNTSIDARFTVVDRRFHDVTEALVEQRQYTEFAFEKLRAELVGEMTGGFGRLDRKLDRVLDALPQTPSSRRRRRS